MPIQNSQHVFGQPPTTTFPLGFIISIRAYVWLLSAGGQPVQCRVSYKDLGIARPMSHLAQHPATSWFRGRYKGPHHGQLENNLSSPLSRGGQGRRLLHWCPMNAEGGWLVWLLKLRTPKDVHPVGFKHPQAAPL